LIKHIVLLNFKPTITPQQIADCLLAATKMLTPIPGVKNFFAGKSLPVRGEPKYKYALLMEFADEAVFKAYREHPEHIKFATQMMRPVVEETLILDYT